VLQRLDATPDVGLAGWHILFSVREVSEMAVDPVCKMNVDPENAPAKSEYEGETYYFCAPGCKAAFDRDPEKYLKGAASKEGHHHSME
jgi:YHS domain-containing protein